MATDITRIRNGGFVGHGGVGKTSLVEAVLFAAGALSRLGRVDDGTTTTDFDPDEVKRKISLNTAVAYCDYRGHRLNLVDTPGYGDFVADDRAGLRVVNAVGDSRYAHQSIPARPDAGLGFHAPTSLCTRRYPPGRL